MRLYVYSVELILQINNKTEYEFARLQLYENG